MATRSGCRYQLVESKNSDNINTINVEEKDSNHNITTTDTINSTSSTIVTNKCNGYCKSYKNQDFCEECLKDIKLLEEAVEKKKVNDQAFKMVIIITKNSCCNIGQTGSSPLSLYIQYRDNQLFFSIAQARQLWQIVLQYVPGEIQWRYAHAIFCRVLDYWNMNERQEDNVGYCYYSMSKSIPKSVDEINNFSGEVFQIRDLIL